METIEFYGQIVPAEGGLQVKSAIADLSPENIRIKGWVELLHFTIWRDPV